MKNLKLKTIPLVGNTTPILWASTSLLIDIAQGDTLIAKWQAFDRGKGQDRSPANQIHRKQKEKWTPSTPKNRNSMIYCKTKLNCFS